MGDRENTIRKHFHRPPFWRADEETANGRNFIDDGFAVHILDSMLVLLCKEDQDGDQEKTRVRIFSTWCVLQSCVVLFLATGLCKRSLRTQRSSRFDAARS